MWVGLGAWSALLFAHGMASVIAGPRQGDPDKPRSKAGWRLTVTPMIGGGHRGLGVAGVF